jgi:hypothetical protein
VWILGALLVVATLDHVPDPPAANPAVSQLSAAWQHEHPVAGIFSCAFTAVSFGLSARLVGVDSIRPFHGDGSIIIVEQAADSSPPYPGSSLHSQA